MFCWDIKLFSPDRLIAPFYLYSNEEEVFSSNFLLQMQNRYLTGPAPEFSAPNNDGLFQDKGRNVEPPAEVRRSPSRREDGIEL